MLLSLAAIWGSSFMFIKVAVEEVTPGEVVFGRVLIGTLALIPAVPFLLGWRQTWSGLRKDARPLLLLGIFNAALPFWLLAWSEQRLVHDIHESCRVLAETHVDEGTRLRVRAPAGMLDELRASLG